MGQKKIQKKMKMLPIQSSPKNHQKRILIITINTSKNPRQVKKPKNYQLKIKKMKN